VTGVQGAHGGHKANGVADAAALTGPLAEFGYGVQDLHSFFLYFSKVCVSFERLPFGRCEVIALLVGGEGVALDVFAIVLNGGADQRARVSVTADKLGWRGEGQVH